MRIGEIANQAGVSRSIIRYYESIGLIPQPQRDGSGYRSYDDCDLERIRTVVNARQLGFSFCDIQELLAMRDLGEAPCPYLLELLERKAAEVDQWINRLRCVGIEVVQLHTLALTFSAAQVQNKSCGYHSSDRITKSNLSLTTSVRFEE